MSSHRYKNNPSKQCLYIWKPAWLSPVKAPWGMMRNPVYDKVFELNLNFFSTSGSITLSFRKRITRSSAKWMPVLVPYSASLVSGWEPAPITRYPLKCHMQAISWTNTHQIRLQFGCDKGIEEQHIISSQLGSAHPEQKAPQWMGCISKQAVAEMGLGVQVTTLFLPLPRLLVHKHSLLCRSFQTGW